ncbi:MAG: aminotransferase class V-fold PLP-dependent enzyme [Clostridia bacterium]|nr:aminotransferase class V-fold PLP-dependent enzyme [Clostridia bacterium]
MMIYLDNAATSYPKPPQVIRAVAGTMEKLGGNPGRSGHRLSLCAGRVINACRESLCELLQAGEPENVIFTANATQALNLAIKGTLHLGDEVLCTPMEHNAVMRVLKEYESQNMISVTPLPMDSLGLVQPHVLQKAITPRTALVVICHASNVTGVIQPVEKLGAVCRENGVPLLVDAAQTAGIMDVGLETLQADMVAMPGHKGLLGPQGMGVLALRRGVLPSPLTFGGTGSRSESMRQPMELPDRYESGTLNLPGIAGLLAGVRFVRQHGSAIRQYEEALTHRLLMGLAGIQGLTILGHPDAPRVGVVSFLLPNMDSSEAADELDRLGFALRGGLHCAPAAHEMLGTLHSGAVRGSVGPYNTEEDVDQLVDAVARLSRL